MKLFGIQAEVTAKARAQISGDTITGEAHFTEYRVGEGKVVCIEMTLQGDPSKLTPGLHAVHIHEKGSCEGEFTCAGGHFDPGPSGNSDPDENHPFHAGDLPNIKIDETGKGSYEAITTRVTLSEGPLCILSGQGSALMIHGKEDPYKGGPHGSGISGGPRIGCGVIKRI